MLASSGFPLSHWRIFYKYLWNDWQFSCNLNPPGPRWAKAGGAQVPEGGRASHARKQHITNGHFIHAGPLLERGRCFYLSAILNFNRLFLKLNQFTWNLLPVFPEHSYHRKTHWIMSMVIVRLQICLLGTSNSMVTLTICTLVYTKVGLRRVQRPIIYFTGPWEDIMIHILNNPSPTKL